jgi:4-hydroxybenzoate polyprenyltransferase
MVFARTAAMSFNRFIDRKFDALNPRTANREIPSGQITARSALLLCVSSSLLFTLIAFFINKICFFLSPVALLVILGYSLTKRFTPLCHLVLGVGLSLAPIGAYLAVVGRFDFEPIILSLIVFTWVSAFDIIYALQDEEFDLSQKLKSIPTLLGKKNALHLSEFIHLLTTTLVIYLGVKGSYGSFYWAGALLFISLLLYQHLIVKPDDLSRVNLAFGTTNGFAGLLFGLAFTLEIVMN